MPEHSIEPVRIMVVDDHPVLREGIAAMLENERDLELVGEASDGTEAISMFRRLRPDVTLMDVQMPGIGGIEAMSAIRHEHPDARIVMLTTYPGDAQAIRALKAGAVGYMLKSSLLDEIVDVVRRVHAGARHVAPEVASGMALHVTSEPLSARELSVLRLVAIGRANKEVALHLGISEETVKAHLKSVFSKLEVADRTHAVTVAIKRGVMEI
jgi:DNA-binding NarL/FixJ family response regulator